MVEVSEQSTTRLRLVFTDYEGITPLIPSSFKYKIDDIASGTILKVMTEVKPVATATYYLTIESAWNTIIAAGRPHEVHRATVEWYTGTVKMGTGIYLWKVVNQALVPLT